jgi:hypothetical protein
MRWRSVALVAWLLGASAVAFGRLPGVATAQPQQEVPLEIFLTQFNYDEQSRTYHVVVSVTDPGRVEKLDPRLLDLQTGENIAWGDAVPVTRPEFDFRLPTEQLQPGRKYRLALRAFRKDTNTYAQRPRQNSAEDPLVFASQEFAYNPPQFAPIVFAVDGVTADFAKHTLLIAVHHSDTTKPLRYEAVVVDKKGGLVARMERANLALQNGIQAVALPAAMEHVEQPSEYHLTFRMYTADNKLVGESGKDFALPAPPSPGLADRMSTALVAFPWLGWSVGGIVACVALIYVVRKVVPRKRRPLPRPYSMEPVYIRGPLTARAQPATAGPWLGAAVDDTSAPHPAFSASAATEAPLAPRSTPTVVSDSATAALLVNSVSGPDERHALTKLETSIGRAVGNDVVIKDEYASRNHARVARQGDSYIWLDNDNVTQPTRINDQRVSASQALHHGDKIEVGRTILVFEAQ